MLKQKLFKTILGSFFTFAVLFSGLTVFAQEELNNLELADGNYEVSVDDIQDTFRFDPTEVDSVYEEGDVVPHEIQDTFGFDEPQDGASKCYLNGERVSCEELTEGAESVVKGILGTFLLLGLIAIFSFVIWLIMLIHAIQNDIEDKTMWVILLIVFGVLAAIVYYFAVKRKFNKEQAQAEAVVQEVDSTDTESM